MIKNSGNMVNFSMILPIGRKKHYSYFELTIDTPYQLEDGKNSDNMVNYNLILPVAKKEH